MSTLNQQLETRIRTFVSELNGLVRQSAVEAVQGALGGQRVSKASKPKNGHARAESSVPRLPKASGRRTRAQLRKTAEGLLTYIKANPGQRMEQIGEALKRETRELRRPLNWLLGKKQIERRGQKRASAYYVAGKAPSMRAARKKAAPKKRAKR